MFSSGKEVWQEAGTKKCKEKVLYDFIRFGLYKVFPIQSCLGLKLRQDLANVKQEEMSCTNQLVLIEM